MMYYDGCIFQPYIHNLNVNAEYRNFFIGNKYVYTVQTLQVNGKNKYLLVPSTHSSLPKIIAFAKKVMHALPQIQYQNIHTPFLLTRIDISCCFSSDKYFVNEIEFVPSIYSDLNHVQDIFMDKLIGDQIILISKNIHSQQISKAYPTTSQIVIYVVCSLLFILFLILFLALRYLKK